MKVFIIFLCVLGAANFIIMALLKRKFNAITSAIFTFMLNGIVVFIFVPYNYVAVYLPLLLIYLAIDVLLATRSKKEK